MDRGPDRRAHGTLGGRPAWNLNRLANLCHILDRYLDAEIESLLLGGVDDCDRPIARRRSFSRELVMNRLVWICDRQRPAFSGSSVAVRITYCSRGPTPARCRSATPRLAPAAGAIPFPLFESAQESRNLIERPLRGGEPDPLNAWPVFAVLPGGVLSSRLQPLQRQCQVCATLGRDERVNFVDDHGVDRPERAPGNLLTVRHRDRRRNSRARPDQAWRTPGTVAGAAGGATTERHRGGRRTPAGIQRIGLSATQARLDEVADSWATRTRKGIAPAAGARRGVAERQRAGVGPREQ